MMRKNVLVIIGIVISFGTVGAAIRSITMRRKRVWASVPRNDRWE